MKATVVTCITRNGPGGTNCQMVYALTSRLILHRALKQIVENNRQFIKYQATDFYKSYNVEI